MDLEGGRSKYVCKVADHEFTIIIGPEGHLSIEPTIILPTPEEYALIIRELKKIGERVVI